MVRTKYLKLLRRNLWFCCLENCVLTQYPIIDSLSAHVDQSVSTIGEDDSDDNKEWRLHSHFRSDDLEILKVHGRTVEIKLGSGHETIIRDLKFDNEDHATKFRDIITKTKNLERERTQRQVAKYRAANVKKSPQAGEGDETMQQSPRDISETVMEEGDGAHIKILVEIVSATDLPIADITSTDAYIIVRFKGKEIHRTRVISKTLDPIWSLTTGSLFLLNMSPEEFFGASSGMLFVIKDYDAVGSNDIIGRVNVSLDDVLNGTGDRVGYNIVPHKPEEDNIVAPIGDVTDQATRPLVEASDKMVRPIIDAADKVVKKAGEVAVDTTGKLLPAISTEKHKAKTSRKPVKLGGDKEQPKLFLRFKKATEDDIAFLEDYNNNPKEFGLYAKESFVPIRKQGTKLLRRQTKKGPKKEILHRVNPGPDPDRPENETKWMTEEQIHAEAMKPSSHWIEAGSGDIGKLFLEVIGCDGLPNMDASTLNLKDKTDAFLNICYEDCIVNTEVIANCMSPRWLPWTQRAFVFNIAHPCSDVFIGVFDHDPERSPLQQLGTAVSDVHDSIGRVVVKAQKFMPDTNYVLTVSGFL